MVDESQKKMFQTNRGLLNTHRIHGTGIFTYIWSIFMVNVGKYTSPMDPMGDECLPQTPILQTPIF